MMHMLIKKLIDMAKSSTLQNKHAACIYVRGKMICTATNSSTTDREKTNSILNLRESTNCCHMKRGIAKQWRKICGRC